VTRKGEAVVIVMAEDDPDDIVLTREAMAQSRIVNDLYIVAAGGELLAYLRHEDRFGPESAPRPHLILLDLNMPRKDGRETLMEIKRDPLLRTIPVVVLTTSSAEEDVWRSYDLGAASYIRKPMTFSGMVETMATLGKYWFEIVELPKVTYRGPPPSVAARASA